jgi:hypothetical protein
VDFLPFAAPIGRSKLGMSRGEWLPELGLLLIEKTPENSFCGIR